MKKSHQNRPVVVSPLEWRSLLKQGKNAGVARSVPIKRAADGTVSFVASSVDADRYGDTIDQAGWETAAFEANPVLLWAHSHSTPPVGKVGALVKDGGPLRATACEFTPAEMHPFGAQVGEMVKNGFLNTVSVGFLPIEWEERYDEGGRFLGYHFKRQELLEISVVPVPANPQALIEGKSFAKSLADWCATPDESAPIARVWQGEVAGFLKAADDLQTRAEDSADANAFGDMLKMLERIAVATEANTIELREMRKAMVSTKASACPSCGAEPGTNIDCAECMSQKSAVASALAVVAGLTAPVVREADLGEDAGDSIANALSGFTDG